MLLRQASKHDPEIARIHIRTRYPAQVQTSYSRRLANDVLDIGKSWVCTNPLFWSFDFSWTGPSWMLAEASTPFLMAWRYYKSDILGLLFLIVFVGVRLVFQCCFYVPYLYYNCNTFVANFCCIPYVLLQIIFTYKIVMKLMGAGKKKDKGMMSIFSLF